MKYIHIILFILPLFIYGQNRLLSEELIVKNDLAYYQGNLYSGTVFDLYKNGKLKYEINYKKGILHGSYLSYFNNGKTQESSFYLDGVIHGYQKTYYSDGNKKTVFKWNMGVLNGVYNTYHPGGLKNVVCSFKNGKQHGDYEQYSDGIFVSSGGDTIYGEPTIIKKTTFKSGKINGLYEEYYKTGSKSRTANYINGELDGNSKVFSWHGGLVIEENFKNGKRHGAYYEYFIPKETRLESCILDLCKKKEVNYVNGSQEGIYTEYHEGNKIKVKCNKLNNKFHGKYIEYDPGGMIICKGTYYRGLKKDSWYFYFTDKTKQYYYEEVYFKIDSNLVINYLNADFNEFRWFTKEKELQKKTVYTSNGFIKPEKLTFAIFGDNMVEYEEVEKYYKQYYFGSNKIKQAGRIEFDQYNIYPIINYNTNLKLYSRNEKVIFSINNDTIFAYKYYKTGELKEKINLRDDAYHHGGLIKTFLENPLDTNNYNEIKYPGNFQNYYKNGIVKSSGYKSYYSGYSKQGKWNYYYDNGQLQQTGEYDSGKKVDEWKEYHPNGTLKCIGSYGYYDDRPHGDLPEFQTGEWKYYNSSGDLIEKGYPCRNGNKCGNWQYYNMGNLYMEKVYSNGEEQKTYNYHDNGNLYMEKVYNNGEEQKTYNYHDNGNLKYKEIKDGDDVYYTSYSYYDNGNLKNVKSYKNNTNNGIWKIYYETGEVKVEMNYQNGVVFSKKCFKINGKKLNCKKIEKLMVGSKN